MRSLLTFAFYLVLVFHVRKTLSHIIYALFRQSVTLNLSCFRKCLMCIEEGPYHIFTHSCDLRFLIMSMNSMGRFVCEANQVLLILRT